MIAMACEPATIEFSNKSQRWLTDAKARVWCAMYQGWKAARCDRNVPIGAQDNTITHGDFNGARDAYPVAAWLSKSQTKSLITPADRRPDQAEPNQH